MENRVKTSVLRGLKLKRKKNALEHFPMELDRWVFARFYSGVRSPGIEIGHSRAPGQLSRLSV